MLNMSIPEGATANRGYFRFWNHLHSIPVALEGVQLGLWLASDIPLPNDVEQGVVCEFGFPQGESFATIRKRLNEQALKQLDWSSVREVPLARFELPSWVNELLADELNYSPTIDGQVNGWWTADKTTPAYRHTGALLPEGGAMKDGCECLVLVDLDDWWGVLSLSGLGSYTFGSDLEAGEAVPFLDDQGRRWEVTRLGDIGHAELAQRWGSAAADRARADKPLVVVKVASLH